jgi:tRNA-splicing ligase RtcB (3'-phosphate/5'-hydroxy nucleic acid ligase)
VPDQAGDYEWRGEGEEAEIMIYAPDAPTAEAAFEASLPAASLPGVVNPVYTASSFGHARSAGSNLDVGWVAASGTHVAPDLFSAPARGLLLVAASSTVALGVPPGEIQDFITRGLSEVALPRLGEAEARAAAEGGALWAAEEGLISEEELALFGVLTTGELDALPRRALSAGARDFDRYRSLEIYQVTEILDTEEADALGLNPGALVIVTSTAPEDLGRLTLAAHRERILERVWREEFGATAELPAAPLGTVEASDLLAAVQTIANYSDARAALRLYALRRALAETGGLELLAAWRLGGLAQESDVILHRQRLAATSTGEALVTRNFVATGTGAMRESAPPFGPDLEEGRWAWEEAGLLERVAALGPAGG